MLTSLKCGKGLEEGRDSSSVWSHPYDIACVGICRGAKENSRENKKKKLKGKEKRDFMSRDGMEVGKKVLHVAQSSLKQIGVFCDSHKQVALTVIIFPFYFYFSLDEGAKQRNNWSTEGNKPRQRNRPNKQGGRAAFPWMGLLWTPGSSLV